MDPELKEAMAELMKALQAIDHRLSVLEKYLLKPRSTSAPSALDGAPGPEKAAPPVSTPPLPSAPAVPGPAEVKSAPPTAPLPPPTSRPVQPPLPPPPRKPRDAASMEKKIAIWLSRIGVVLVFFAAAFFLKLAMDRMGPVGKVAVGIFVGLLFIGGGEYMERRESPPLARALTGGGLMILYLTIFAAFSFLKIIGSPPAFFFMVLVTAAGVTLALRYDSQVILVLALLGGFATPVMVSTGTDQQAALMSYMLLLDSALVGVSYWRRWRGINVLCFLATVVLFLGWSAKFYRVEKLGITVFFASAFFVVFAIADVIHGLVRKREAKVEDLGLISANAAAYFALVYTLLSHSGHDKLLGTLAFSLTAFYFIQVRAAMALIPKDRNIQSFLTGFAVAFLTMAIPLQLDYESVTVIWAAEAVALSGYGLYGKNELIRWSGLVVLVITIGHLFGADPEIYRRHLRAGESAGLIVSIIITYGCVLAATGAVIWFYRRFAERAPLPREAMVGAYLFEIALGLIFMLVLNHYAFRVGTGMHGRAPRGEVLNISLILGVYSSVLIAIGILFRSKWMRYAGLPLLAFTLLKVVFYDLRGLPLSQRMVSFFALGALSIGLSFLYTKYKDRIEGIALAGPSPSEEKQR